jgi:hypothetical protein
VRIGFRAVALATLLAAAAAAGAESACDPHLRFRSSDPLRYMMRDDRCEGVYLADVSSATLHLASFTASFEDFDPTTASELVLRWAAPGPGAVRVRAVALKPRVYYRMDTVRAGEEPAFRWPTNVLAGLRLGRSELGLVAWTSVTRGEMGREVYLPLRVAPREPSGAVRSYRLVLWPGRELAEVYLSLAPVSADGRPERYVFEGRPLRHGFYPADRGVVVNLAASEFRAPGVYYLEVGATPRSGPPIAVQHWIYHPGG